MAQQTKDRVLAGRYRVLERLGSGGMAAVYLAEDERLGRRVAIKQLHADSHDDTAARFAREAKLLASLNHPNIVSVFDTVSDGESVLIVMEYVEGETLNEALRRGPLDPERVGAVIEGVAAALDHAHQHGVVHRDVKPGNILLGRDQVKLADLGIAKAAEGTQVTRTGTVLGTPSYMAPEQLEGRQLSPAVDVYALAAVAWEALAGRKAREGRTPMEIAHRVATEPPQDLREAWPAAPAEAADVLRRGMAREPSARPAGAGALARQLSAALTREERTAATRRLGAAPPPAAGVPRGPVRRGLAAWIPLVLLVAVVAAVVALAAGDGDDPERGAATPAQPEPDPAPREEQAPREQAPEAETSQPEDPVARGVELNDQGFGLMGQGRHEEAVPLLQESVELLEGSGRVEYWYALFNLGQSLRLSGRPAEAIPLLEQRLRYPDQRGTVERELELAREQAGQGGGEGEGRGKKKGKKEDD